MITTSKGLPNTCFVCGKPAGDEWYAEHEDGARSGSGFCSIECGNAYLADKNISQSKQRKPGYETPIDPTQFRKMGPSRAETLAQAGITNVGQLAYESYRVVAAGFSEVLASLWNSDALDIINNTTKPDQPT